jgi:hypothetical protein
MTAEDEVLLDELLTAIRDCARPDMGLGTVKTIAVPWLVALHRDYKRVQAELESLKARITELERENERQADYEREQAEYE